MSDEIKKLEREVDLYKKLYNDKDKCFLALLDKYCDNYNPKPKSLKEELLKELKEYLDLQDLQNVGKSLKFSTQYVQNVLNDKCNDNNVINALHTQALANKELLLTSYQQMIDTLKQ